MPNVSIPIAIQRKAELIERLSQGEMIKSIAKDFGCHPTAISHAMKGDEDYLQAQIDYHASRLDIAEEMLLEAATHEDSSSRASRASSAAALWKAYSWRASVEQRRIWGNEPSIVINTGVSIDQALGQSALSLLDKLRTVSTQRQEGGGDGGVCPDSDETPPGR